jgi:myo-inositol-1(or 4)-monophosphatase
VGVIYFPQEDELFYARIEHGAFCNDKPIRVSENADLSKSIIAYDNQFHLSARSFEYYERLVKRAFTTRILGVATRDVCLTASGVVDGRIFLNTKIFDIAASNVILTEAGGMITEMDGAPVSLHSKHVVASNGKVHQQLLEIF